MRVLVGLLKGAKDPKVLPFGARKSGIVEKYTGAKEAEIRATTSMT
jgi:hypothetical protein